jgi:putative alpha-1,2-mannosidase
LLNGKPLSSLFINHSDIIAGGKLTFYMGPKPQRSLHKREGSKAN